MAEIKYTSDKGTPQQRIANRLRNSGVGCGTMPDATVQTGNSARRTFHNLHNSTVKQRGDVAGTPKPKAGPLG